MSRRRAAYPPLRARVAPGLPIAKMVIGKPADEAAVFLPRVFNLCREAQGLAARAAFGLPLDGGHHDALRREVMRDHILKLCLKWPAALNRPGVPIPDAWEKGGIGARQAIFGSKGRMPRTVDEWLVYLRCGDGIAPIFGAITDLFAPGVACRRPRPLATAAAMFDGTICENSTAARQASHPVMTHVQDVYGRGPLWSALGVAYDLQSIWSGDLPDIDLAPGRAVVPASRGLYGVTAQVDDGIVTAFSRVTPTDHLMNKGGPLDQSLASLNVSAHDPRAIVLLSILDPCYSVNLEPVDKAKSTAREPRHA